MREITILVLGTSNSGKSTFINWAAESLSNRPVSQLVATRRGLAAETGEVKEVLVSFSEEVMVRFVDTPGLDHTYMPDAAVFKVVATWLQDSFSRGTRVCSILYLHNITQEWITSSMRLDIESLSKSCGDQVMKNDMITILTTRWGAVPLEEGEAKEAELAGSLWLGLGPEGNKCPPVKRVDDQHSAKRFINSHLPKLLKRECSPLYIQEELVIRRLTLDMTDAGRCFSAKAQGLPKATTSSSTRKGLSYLISKNLKSEPRDLILGQGCDSDVVIPFMGQTKAGKSSLINTLVGSDRVRVGPDMVSCTKQLEAVAVVQVPERCAALHEALGDRRIVFLDTPGFDDTELGDDEVLIRIAKWLEVSYRKGMLVGGVLYLQDITKDAWTGTSRKNLGVFEKICGDSAMSQVALLTTKWGSVPESQLGAAIKRVDQLKGHWAGLMENGASAYHLQPPHRPELAEEAVQDPWDIITNIVRSKQAQEYILLLQHELVRERRFLAESQAGEELCLSLETLLMQAKADQRAAKRGGSLGQDRMALEIRQKEIDLLRRRLDHFKPGISQRLFRWVYSSFVRQPVAVAVTSQLSTP